MFNYGLVLIDEYYKWTNKCWCFLFPTWSTQRMHKIGIKYIQIVKYSILYEVVVNWNTFDSTEFDKTRIGNSELLSFKSSIAIKCSSSII